MLDVGVFSRTFLDKIDQIRQLTPISTTSEVLREIDLWKSAFGQNRQTSEDGIANQARDLQEYSVDLDSLISSASTPSGDAVQFDSQLYHIHEMRKSLIPFTTGKLKKNFQSLGLSQSFLSFFLWFSLN